MAKTIKRKGFRKAQKLERIGSLPSIEESTRVSDAEIQRVEYLLNTRPRKRFGGKTPLEVLLETTGVAITY